MKIAGCAGHGGFKAPNVYATPGKRTPDGQPEWEFNNKVILAFEEALKQYEGAEFLRTDDRSGKTDVPLKDRVDKANNWGAHVYISYHHNANKSIWGTHGGTETLIQLGVNGKSLQLAQEIHPRIMKAYGLRDRGIKHQDLYITRKTKMPAVLIEGGFMDSTIDIKKLRDDSVLKAAGYAVAEAVAAYGGLKKKVVAPPVVVAKPTYSLDTIPVKNPHTYRLAKLIDTSDKALIDQLKKEGYRITALPTEE